MIPIGKEEKLPKKLEKKSNKKSVSSGRILRKHLTKITANELKKLKTDVPYKERFLLAVRLVTSELKTIVFKK